MIKVQTINIVRMASGGTMTVSLAKLKSMESKWDVVLKGSEKSGLLTTNYYEAEWKDA